MLIAIPSKGRPMGVKTKKILPSASVFVPQSEVKDYEKCGVTNVVGVPDSVKGITATRNWILDNCGDPWVVMVDDDVKQQGYVKLEHDRSKHKKMDESDWLEECVKLFDLTDQLNYRV